MIHESWLFTVNIFFLVKYWSHCRKIKWHFLKVIFRPWWNPPYGRFHWGQELTSIELGIYCFACEPLNWWIYFLTFCSLVCMFINIKVLPQAFSLPSSLLKLGLNSLWTWLPNTFLKCGVPLSAISFPLEILIGILDFFIQKALGIIFPKQSLLNSFEEKSRLRKFIY